MAIEILNAKKVTDNGLLSKIQIGGKTYEIKDLIARENLQALALLIDSLDLEKADKEQVTKDIAAAIAGKADKDQVAKDIAAAVADKADKTQVATDIAAAVAAEAALREEADNALDERLDSVETFFKVAEGETLDAALDTLKEIQDYVNTHGAAADKMVKDIAANAKAIADEAKAREDADTAIDGRLDAIETALGDGEGSVADQIADAKQAAITAAKGYTDGEIDKVETEVAKKEDKTNLKALAYKDSASGTVAGQTISGVKATGTSAGDITVELEQSEHAMNSTGKFTPAGNVTGTVTTAGSISVTASHTSANATLTKGDYTPAGTVAVALSGAEFNAITGVGTQASFVEGAFTPATLTYSAADYSVAKEGIVGSVDENECLVFTNAGLEAISASKVTAFNGGSKAADQFTANSLPTMTAQKVGVQSATFAGTTAEGALVTGVSYDKASIGSATFTGETVDITAKFAGTEGDLSVTGTCHDYAVKTAEFVPDAIEVAVGDIVVAEKSVTVQ